MDATVIKTISDNGVTLVIVAIFIWLITHYVKGIGPKVDALTELIRTKNASFDELQKISEASAKALDDVAQSNNNVAHALKALNITLEGQQELMRLLHDDTKETQSRMYSHDDRSEKIYTMLHKMYTDQYGGK